MSTDKRIIKTRTSIKNALMELACDREIGKISVSELASKAMVNRSTFYLHYPDVPAVAADIEKEIAHIIETGIDDFSITDIYSSVYTLFRKLTNRLENNQLMKRYIIYSTNSYNVLESINNVFVGKTLSIITKKFPDTDENKIIFPLTFAASGITNTYIKWVGDDKNITLEELIKEISALTEYIISTVTK